MSLHLLELSTQGLIPIHSSLVGSDKICVLWCQRGIARMLATSRRRELLLMNRWGVLRRAGLLKVGREVLGRHCMVWCAAKLLL